MKIAVLTTSFPLTPDSMSGIFIYRLVAYLPREIQTTILTPSAKKTPAPNTHFFKLKCFRYAPSPWQILAHGPGGINAALKRNKLLYLLLPFFFSLNVFRLCEIGQKKRSASCKLVNQRSDCRTGWENNPHTGYHNSTR